MADDEQTGGTDYPEQGAQRRGEPEQGDADDEETCVQGFLGHDVITDLHRFRSCITIYSQ